MFRAPACKNLILGMTVFACMSEIDFYQYEALESRYDGEYSALVMQHFCEVCGSWSKPSSLVNSMWLCIRTASNLGRIWDWWFLALSIYQDEDVLTQITHSQGLGPRNRVCWRRRRHCWSQSTSRHPLCLWALMKICWPQTHPHWWLLELALQDTHPCFCR